MIGETFKDDCSPVEDELNFFALVEFLFDVKPTQASIQIIF